MSLVIVDGRAVWHLLVGIVGILADVVASRVIHECGRVDYEIARSFFHCWSLSHGCV